MAKRSRQKSQQAHTYEAQSRDKRRESIMYAVKRLLKTQHVNIPPYAMALLERTLDPRRYYRIEVIRDPMKAAERLLLRNYETTCYNDDSDGVLEVARCIYGKVSKYGMRYFHRRMSEPGKPFHGCCDYDYPCFSTNKVFIVIVERCDWVMKHKQARSKEKEAIIIYAPNLNSKTVNRSGEDIVCDIKFDYRSSIAPVTELMTIKGGEDPPWALSF